MVLCLPCLALAAGHSFACVHAKVAERVKRVLPQPLYSLPSTISLLWPLNQDWGVFIGPVSTDMWQAQIGVLENGHMFNLQIGQVYKWPPSPGDFSPPNTNLEFLEKTETLSGGGFTNDFWRDFFLVKNNYNMAHDHVGIFACSQYQRRKSMTSPPLHSVYSLTLWREISLDKKVWYPLAGKVTWTHRCDDSKNSSSDDVHDRMVISQLKSFMIVHNLGVQISSLAEEQSISRRTEQPRKHSVNHALISSDGSIGGAHRLVRRNAGHEQRVFPKQR